MHDAALKLGQVGHMYIIVKSAFAAQTCRLQHFLQYKSLFKVSMSLVNL